MHTVSVHTHCLMCDSGDLGVLGIRSGVGVHGA